MIFFFSLCPIYIKMKITIVWKERGIHMKKVLRTLTAVGTAALAVVGGIYIFRKFFAKEEELDEAFDDDELFEEDPEEEDDNAFDIEEEIFEEEAAAPSEAPEAEAFEASS